MTPKYPVGLLADFPVIAYSGFFIQQIIHKIPPKMGISYILAENLIKN